MDTAAEAPVLEFHPRHSASVLSGEKTSTTRWNEAVEPGPVQIRFEGRPDLGACAAEVLEVRSYPARSITAEQALQPEGTSMREFCRQLREHYYPEMPEDAMLDVVRFRLL